MKRKLTIALLFVLPAILLLSCEKQWMGSDPDDDPLTNFEFLWREIGDKYVFFEYKGVDWDRMYTKYRPRIYMDMNDRELFEVLADMLYELRDGHVNLTAPFDRSRNWSWYLDYKPNFNETIVYREYLGDDYLITGPLHNQVIDSVVYVYYPSFGRTIREEHIDLLVERTRGMKGLIIDIRDNGGGSLSNGEALAAALTSNEYLYGRSRIKTGPGADAFSEWKDMRISPRDGDRFTGHVVLLCNRKSYSASNIFAQMMKSLPHAVLMGDDTGGGGGIPAYGELPNGWIFRFSASQIQNPHGNHIEDGVVVDIPVELDPAEETRDVDTIIEAALDLLNVSR